MDEAIHCMRHATDAKPTARRWNALGGLLCLRGQWDEALRAFREVEGIQGPRPMVLENIALMLWKVGRAEEGLAFVDDACRLDPKCILHATNRCLILADIGRSAEAMSELQRVEEMYRPLEGTRRADRLGLTQAVDNCRERLKAKAAVFDPDLL